MFRSLILLSTLITINGLALKPANMSRRKALFTGAATIITTTALTTNPTQAQAQAMNNALITTEESVKGAAQRMELLQFIKEKRSDEEIELAIQRLEVLDPSHKKAAVSDRLGGTWELIYSVNAAAFSPLLNLPKAIRPTSLQLIGKDAVPVVGAGRIAQVLNFPILPVSLILSSGTEPVHTDASVLEIFPPFRFDATFGGIRREIVNAGSDKDFRALNARTEEAQVAGRNMYKQRYLDTSGEKGDLRISEVISGDPVLVAHLRLEQFRS